jgi:hypothetical protein
METREKSEIRAQSDAYQAVYNEFPYLRGRIFAINNNSENAIKGAMNKAMGVFEGVSDMCLVCQGGRVVWIEWKTTTGKQSKAQVSWQELVESLGHVYQIVRNESEFREVLNKYQCS